jgi:hypothetical protein
VNRHAAEVDFAPQPDVPDIEHQIREGSAGSLRHYVQICLPFMSAYGDGSLGTRRIYSLNPDGVAALRAWLDGVWNDALTESHKLAETSPYPDGLDNPCP